LKLKSIYVPGKNGNMMQLFPVRPPNKAFACRYASLKVFHTATQEVRSSPKFLNLHDSAPKP
jgi:hypothetical protein